MTLFRRGFRRGVDPRGSYGLGFRRGVDPRGYGLGIVKKKIKKEKKVKYFRHLKR